MSGGIDWRTLLDAVISHLQHNVDQLQRAINTYVKMFGENAEYVKNMNKVLGQFYLAFTMLHEVKKQALQEGEEIKAVLIGLEAELKSKIEEIENGKRP